MNLLLCRKIIKVTSTIVLILSLILGSITLAFASPEFQIGPEDENNSEAQTFPEEIIEYIPPTDVDNNVEYPETLLSDEMHIERSRLHFFSLAILQLENRERNVIVYLPSDYQIGNNSYPVIYVLDAQNLFIQSNISPEDRVLNEFLFQFYTQVFDREAIVVAIESDPIHMWDEYSPWINQNMYLWMDPYDANQVEGGEGDAFLNFLIETLKPVIDSSYRTLADRENTSIGGSKMGGVLSIYAGLTQAEVYSKVMAMSPSVWFAESGEAWLSGNQMLIFIDRNGVPDKVRFYLDVDSADQVTDLVVRPAILDAQGSKISFPQAYLEGTQALVDVMYRRGISASSITGGLDTPIEPTDTLVEPINIPIEQIDTPTDLIDAPMVQLDTPMEPTVAAAESSETLSQSTDTNVELPNVLFGDVVYDHFSYLPLIIRSAIPPLITSAASATFTKSSESSFTVTTTGYPVPTISISGTLPAGIIFTDNKNGTAKISGTPTNFGTYTLSITAQNGVAPNATQILTLKVVGGCPTTNSCLLTFSVDMSPYLSRTRNVSVYLPPNYQSGASYSVIYLTDAQHQFGAQIGVAVEDYNDWKMDETLDSYYISKGRGVVAVGIWFDANNPYSEYTLSKNLNMDHWASGLSPLDNPEGEAMINFIRYKLKPEIDSNFHTLTDRTHTAIGGGSRCALIALYSGLIAPETFSKVMSMSPAVWIAEGGPRVSLSVWPDWFVANGLQAWFNAYQAPTNVQYFIYIGTNEVTGYAKPYVRTPEGYQITIQAAYLNGAVRVRDQLKYREGVIVANLAYVQNDGGTHLASVWRTYANQVLTWFGY